MNNIVERLRNSAVRKKSRALVVFCSERKKRR